MTCKQCGNGVTPWKYTYPCGNCEDGIAHATRDIDYDPSGFCKCYECSGSGEKTQTVTHFCSEDCMEDYENDNFYY